MPTIERIKVVSLNVEGREHLKLIKPFLKKIKPEVVLLQESFERDGYDLGEKLDMNTAFAPVRRRPYLDALDGSLQKWGLTTLSRYDFGKIEIFNYVQDKEKEIPMFTSFGINNRFRRPLLITEVIKNGALFRFINLHFTWTPDGKANDFQRGDLKVILNYLPQFSELILCGDFNAPRGREIFDKIASLYKDNIPSNIQTTLDQKLHKIPGLMLVVDGMFTTDGYLAENVRVVDGVSDHCAIVANIKHTENNLNLV